MTKVSSRTLAPLEPLGRLSFNLSRLCMCVLFNIFNQSIRQPLLSPSILLDLINNEMSLLQECATHEHFHELQVWSTVLTVFLLSESDRFVLCLLLPRRSEFVQQPVLKKLVLQALLNDNIERAICEQYVLNFKTR